MEEVKGDSGREPERPRSLARRAAVSAAVGLGLAPFVGVVVGFGGLFLSQLPMALMGSKRGNLTVREYIHSTNAFFEYWSYSLCGYAVLIALTAIVWRTAKSPKYNARLAAAMFWCAAFMVYDTVFGGHSGILGRWLDFELFFLAFSVAPALYFLVFVIGVSIKKRLGLDDWQLNVIIAFVAPVLPSSLLYTFWYPLMDAFIKL